MENKSLTEQIARIICDDRCNWNAHQRCTWNKDDKPCPANLSFANKILSLLRSLDNKDLLLKEKDLEEPDEEIPITHYPYGSETVSRLYLFRLAKEQGFLEDQLDKASVKIKALEEENRGLRESLAELIEAMHRYEMDVDDPPPYKHREMMHKARVILDSLKEQEG